MPPPAQSIPVANVSNSVSVSTTSEVKLERTWSMNSTLSVFMNLELSSKSNFDLLTQLILTTHFQWFALFSSNLHFNVRLLRYHRFRKLGVTFTYVTSRPLFA